MNTAAKVLVIASGLTSVLSLFKTGKTLKMVNGKNSFLTEAQKKDINKSAVIGAAAHVGVCVLAVVAFAKD